MKKCESYKEGDCKFNKDGICQKHKSKEDGLSLRCSGFWSENKVKHFKYYTEMFATGMKNFWPNNRYYIDLFSGPGKCIIREGLKEINGSCLEAVNLKDRFTAYFFVDKNPICIDDLKKRINEDKNVEYYNEDCNVAVEKIIKNIPTFSLSLAIIDPDSLQFQFDSYKKLSERKIDLIVNYPINPISRAISAVQKKRSNSEILDKFHPGWREIMDKKTWGHSNEAKIINLVKDYINKIEDLGYFSSDLLIPFKNEKNSTLYYLVAFSKDKRGIDFWEKATKSLRNKINKPLF